MFRGIMLNEKPIVDQRAFPVIGCFTSSQWHPLFGNDAHMHYLAWHAMVAVSFFLLTLLFL